MYQVLLFHKILEKEMCSQRLILDRFKDIVKIISRNLNFSSSNKLQIRLNSPDMEESTLMNT